MEPKHDIELKTGTMGSSSSFGIALPATESYVENLVEILSELYDLLEEYAPSWYGQEQHDKLEAALRCARVR